MKRLKIIGLSLLALFALGALAATMASAEEGVLPQGSAATGSAGKTKLQNLKGEEIECTSVKILALQWLPKSDQHGTTDLHFAGCKAEKLVPFNSLGDEKEVVLLKVLYLVCLVNSASLTFGLLIQPLETVHTEVPAVKALLLVKGVLIAQLVTKKLQGKEFEYNLEGSKGVQTIAKECEINGTKFKHSYESSKDSEADDPMSQSGPFKLTYTAEVELMDT